MADYKDPLPNNIVERAYQIARSGECSSITDLEKRLRKLGYQGGYVEAHLGGTAIRRSLRQMIKEASTSSSASQDESKKG